MGNIMIWLARGLYLGGGAIIGVLFEKISGWIAGLLPSTVNVREKSGGYAIWFIVAVATIAGAVLYFLVRMLTGKKKVFTLVALALCTAADLLIGTGGPLIAAGVLFSIAAASTETKSVSYCPEYISFTIDAVPTSFKIEVLGDGVVFSLDGTGMTNLNGIRLVGELPANTYVYHITDGYIRKNANFTIANASAGTALAVNGWSDSEGANYVIHEQSKAFAGQSLDLPPFLYAAFPSMAATDSLTLNWFKDAERPNRGVVSDTVTRLELQSLLAYTQEVSSTRYNLDNWNQRIAGARFLGAADQALYLMRAAAAK